MPQSRHSKSSRWLAALALWALLASQWLAQLHEIAHGSSQAVSAVSAGPLVDAATSPTSWAGQALEASAAHDAGSALCQLIRQLAHSSIAPSLPVTAFVPPAPPPLPAPRNLGRPAPPPAAYSARAPPLLA
jgi:hypothetical protein